MLIPIALALLLTFLLNPLVRILQRRGLGRVFCVLSAVSIVGVILMSLGALVTHQIGGMMAELPQNTANIKAKVTTLRSLGSGPVANQFARMFQEISRTVPVPAGVESPSGLPKRIGEGAEQKSPAQTILLQAESNPWFFLTGYLGSAFDVLATLAFTLVLLVVFLLGGNDLRDRMVLLAGNARLALTSKALEDVTDRISRYLLMVALVNGGFGVLLTVGLFFLQVPYALLWGFLAAGLRFIPYIGPWVGAVFPLAMSLATADGWSLPISVFGYILVLELIGNNVIEPLVFGRSTGVSSTALLISAAFWLYLWGPIGLVLSAPIAVCLVVLGKNLPQLRFLNLLLGDVPALRANVGLYQRLMLGDEHESARLILQRMKAFPPEEVYDEMLIPALNYARRDVHREYLTNEDQSMILKGLRKMLRETDVFLQTPSASANEPLDLTSKDNGVTSGSVIKTARILGCPAMDDTDCVGLEMLRQLLDPTGWELEVTAVETLTSELSARIARDPPDIVCIVSLPPGGLAHARYLCKRLREASPGIFIIVGRWGQRRTSRVHREQLLEAGATVVTTTLLDTRQLLESRLPLLRRTIPTELVSAAPEKTVSRDLVLNVSDS